MTKTLEKTEFGDFQTPVPLAMEVCQFLARLGVSPASVVEPTCGKGSFLSAALNTFDDVDALGYDINAAYVSQCQRTLANFPRCNVHVSDFFDTEWSTVLSNLPDPILIIGNPPWVTNSELGGIGSSNLPRKSNFQSLKGLEAITGKSNFDISEAMLLHLLDAISGRNASLAVLCKTVVVRRVLRHVWKHGLEIGKAEVYRIDAATHFNAAVDACLFYCETQANLPSKICHVYKSLNRESLDQTFGYCDGRLVAEINSFSKWNHLAGKSLYKWRSGVKHDCSRVMELSETPDGLQNGLGEKVHVENKHLYPMLKSSELANGRTKSPSRRMVVPQKEIGRETSTLLDDAPNLWHYLLDHAEYLDKRGSSIYRNRPRFSVFGVGGYSFSPWKIAVSGFYKSLNFVLLGPFNGQPILLDDTAYLLACQSEEEARFLYELLTSRPASEFYSSLIFWDSKRPITTELLSALNLEALAQTLGRSEEYEVYSSTNPWVDGALAGQKTLFE